MYLRLVTFNLKEMTIISTIILPKLTPITYSRAFILREDIMFIGITATNLSLVDPPNFLKLLSNDIQQ